MEKIKKIFKALVNKETILYVICGVLTTLVALVTLKAFTLVFGEKLYLLSNTFSWICAVVFAYIVNKLLVFESKSWSISVLKKEIPSFLAARIASYFIEEAGLWLMMSPMKMEGKVYDLILFKLSGLMIAKLAVGVLVVIINYGLSKFIIFKKPKEKESSD